MLKTPKFPFDRCHFYFIIACNADFGFLLDSSGSVDSHWQRQLGFVKQIVKSINLSSNGGRAAVAEFSNKAELMIKFSDYITLKGFESAVDKLDHWHGTTKIELGLEVALNQMFKQSNGMRPNVPHTLVLITDAQQTRVEFEKFRKQFNERKIRVLVILVGNGRKEDIRFLANRDADLYEAKSFDELITEPFVRSITLCGGNLKINSLECPIH